MARLILDSGAVIALASRRARARMMVEQAITQGRIVVLPAVVIAETTRGGLRDAAVNRVINGVNEITPVTVHVARQAGRLLARAGINATLDALIVAEAVLGGPAVILTSDPGDISALAEGFRYVKVEPL